MNVYRPGPRACADRCAHDPDKARSLLAQAFPPGKAVPENHIDFDDDGTQRAVAQAIQANLRGTDMVGRFGGEEFMLILTETNVEEGAVLTEKLRMIVSRLRFSVEENPDLARLVFLGLAVASGLTG